MNNGCMGCLFFWWPKMTDYRKDKLATFSLNMAVVCIGVMMFEGRYWAGIPALVFVVLFLLLTRGK